LQAWLSALVGTFLEAMTICDATHAKLLFLELDDGFCLKGKTDLVLMGTEDWHVHALFEIKVFLTQASFKYQTLLEAAAWSAALHGNFQRASLIADRSKSNGRILGFTLNGFRLYRCVWFDKDSYGFDLMPSDTAEELIDSLARMLTSVTDQKMPWSRSPIRTRRMTELLQSRTDGSSDDDPNQGGGYASGRIPSRQPQAEQGPIVKEQARPADGASGNSSGGRRQPLDTLSNSHCNRQHHEFGHSITLSKAFVASRQLQRKEWLATLADF
jgi:hypothetical protein